jgi:hypothetical protein
MAGPWDKYKTSEAQAEGPWKKFQPPSNVPVEQKSLGDKALSAAQEVGSFFTEGSIGEKVPIIGPLATKAGEHFQAAVDYGVNLGDKPYSQALSEVQGRGKAAGDQFAKEHPYASTAQDLVGGGVGSLLLPIPGAGMTGLAGAAARTAGSAGMSALDSFTRGDSGEQVQGAAKLSGGIQAVAEGVSPLVGKFAGPIAKSVDDLGRALEDYSAIKAVKHAFGNNKKAWKELGDRDVWLGKAALSSAEDLSSAEVKKVIEPVVKFGRSAAQTEKHAEDAAKKTWGGVSRIMEAADKAGAQVSGKSVADDIMKYAAKLDPISRDNEKLQEELMAAAMKFESRGQFRLAEAQDIKSKAFSWESKPYEKKLQDVLGKNGNNIINKSIGNAIKKAIVESKVESADKFEKLYKQFGVYAELRDKAKNTAIDLQKNRPVGLFDVIIGTGAGIGAIVQNGDLEDAGMRAIALGAASNLIRKRGSSAIAVGLNKLANAMVSSPEKVRKYYDVFEKAAKKGSVGVAAAHEMLLAKDRQYRELIESEKGQSIMPEKKKASILP